eukprot:6178077-Pleurochrysis_carterae.AAC.3
MHSGMAALRARTARGTSPSGLYASSPRFVFSSSGTYTYARYAQCDDERQCARAHPHLRANARGGGGLRGATKASHTFGKRMNERTPYPQASLASAIMLSRLWRLSRCERCKSKWTWQPHAGSHSHASANLVSHQEVDAGVR